MSTSKGFQKVYTSSSKGQATASSRNDASRLSNEDGKAKGTGPTCTGSSDRANNWPTAQLERYLQEERDFRSLAVENFDPHQQESRQQHQMKLDQAVRRSY